MNWRVAVIAALLSTGAAGVAAGSDITVVSFGRADQAALTKAYYRPFRAATGIGVKSLSYDGETTELERMVKAGKVDWDVMQVESGTLERGCRDGLFEKLDYGRIGKTSDFIRGAVSECGVGIFAWSVALAYDASRLATAPRSWADFWNLKQYPGRRGLRRSAKYTLEIALLADGVPPGDVYKVLGTEQGVDRAFRKLDQIKAETTWWDAAPQPAELLEGRLVVMSAAYTLWVDRDHQRNRNIRIAWNGSLYDVDNWAIPKGTPRIADAYQFISFASRPGNQKALSEQLPYGPANRKALALLGASLARRMPSAEATLERAVRVDPDFWIEHGAALEQRFAAWVPPLCRQQTDEDEEYIDQPGCQDITGRLHPGKAAKTNPR